MASRSEAITQSKDPYPRETLPGLGSCIAGEMLFYAGGRVQVQGFFDSAQDDSASARDERRPVLGIVEGTPALPLLSKDL
jgi:hypothetical protein